MKLHYNNEAFASNRYRKIRAVANALGVNLEEIAHDSTADLSSISPFNTLPLLQTAQGTFFSSNTIIRYLATTQGKLYGGQNNHHQSLVDQWLDVTVCDLEAAVAAVALATEGKTPIDGAKVAEDINKFLAGLEGQVTGKKFIVGDGLTIADISVATALSVVFAHVLGE
jgi:glutathione S-transferase